MAPRWPGHPPEGCPLDKDTNPICAHEGPTLMTEASCKGPNSTHSRWELDFHINLAGKHIHAIAPINP